MNRSTISSASAVSQARRQCSIHWSGSYRDNLQGSWRRTLPPAPRQRFLRFHAVLSALLASPFLLPFPCSWIFLLLILTLDSCILILLCCPSHQCTSERARSIKRPAPTGGVDHRVRVFRGWTTRPQGRLRHLLRGVGWGEEGHGGFGFRLSQRGALRGSMGQAASDGVDGDAFVRGIGAAGPVEGRHPCAACVVQADQSPFVVGDRAAGAAALGR